MHYQSFALNFFSNNKLQIKGSLLRVFKRDADSLNNDIASFSSHFSKGFRASEKLSMAYFELTQDYSKLRDLYESLNILNDSIQDAILNSISMRDAASSISFVNPKMTKSRKYWIDTCNKIIEYSKQKNKCVLV